MSDIEEDYFSENDSESEDSDNEEIEKKNKKPNPISIKGIDDDLNKSDDEDDDDDISVDDEDENDLYGGAKSGDDNDDSEDDNDDSEDDDDDEINGENEGEIKVKEKKKQKIIIEENLEEEDSDEENLEENYLQKFDKDINTSYIEDFHPECKIHNYDEISLFTKVSRDNDNIISDPLHKTIPFLTKYEKARVIGQRSKQIECGAMPLVKVPENIIDSYIIAELELQQKVIPFIIKRPIPGGGCEYWNIKDLELITF